MPIDFEALIAPFRDPMKRQLKSIAAVFKQLGVWLTAELPKIKAAERATKDYPIIQFRNGAMTVWIDERQWGQLTPNVRPPTVGQRLGVVWSRFSAAFARIPQAVEEDLLLPRLFILFDRMMEVVQRAVHRAIPRGPGIGGYQVSSRIFDLSRPRTASDIFGGLAVAGRGYFLSRNQIARLMFDARLLHRVVGTLRFGDLLNPFDQVGAAFHAVRTRIYTFFGLSLETGTNAADGTGAGASAAPAPTLSTFQQLQAVPQQLAQAVNWIAGAILILPILPQLLRPIIAAAQLRLKVYILDQFQRIERQVFGLRRKVFDFFFNDFRRFVRNIYDVLVVVEWIALRQLAFYIRFAELYLQEVLKRFKDYFTQVSGVLRRYTGFAAFFQRVLEGFLDYDLFSPLKSIWPSWAPGLPTYRLRDFIGDMISGQIGATRALLDGALATVMIFLETRLGRWLDRKSGMRLWWRVGSLREVLHYLLQMPGHPGTPARPSLHHIRFPDLYGAFAREAGPFVRQLARLRAETVNGVTQVLGAGADLLDNTSRVFANAARDAALLGSPARYRAISRQAIRLTNLLYGPQIRMLARRARTRSRTDLLARSFERELRRPNTGTSSRGLFYIIEGAIPLYLQALRRRWHTLAARRVEGRWGASELEPYPAHSPHVRRHPNLPTSPHILADRRARMGRVWVPRLTIRARGQALTEPFANAVAERFKTEVEAAYTVGLNQLPR